MTTISNAASGGRIGSLATLGSRWMGRGIIVLAVAAGMTCCIILYQNSYYVDKWIHNTIFMLIVPTKECYSSIKFLM